jgi:hypothetical protein
MVMKLARLAVDFAAGISIGLCAIVLWWFGLALFEVSFVRLGGALGSPPGPMAVLALVVYCPFSLWLSKPLERRLF